MSGNRTAPCIAPICGLLSATYSQKVPWFGTVRPRIGYAAGSWMVYATGGFAYGDHDTNATAAVGGLVATHNQSETRNGFAVGGGAEMEFAPRWTAKIEYLYVDLGRGTTTLLAAPLLTSKSRLDLNLIRTGVNYRF
jgi:outer membrane immunogenic protein